MAEDYPSIELNGQSLETEEKCCYFGDKIVSQGGAVDSVITRVRSGWIRDFVSLLASRGLPFGG